MKKILLVLCIPVFIFGNMFAVENNTERMLNEQQELRVDETAPSVDALTFKKKALKAKKDSKIKKFFKKLNPFKNVQDDLANYIVAFILGLLLGVIGVLITFLIYLNHDNRKRIVTFSWLGWLWWLVIFSLILL